MNSSKCLAICFLRLSFSRCCLGDLGSLCKTMSSTDVGSDLTASSAFSCGISASARASQPILGISALVVPLLLLASQPLLGHLSPFSFLLCLLLASQPLLSHLSPSLSRLLFCWPREHLSSLPRAVLGRWWKQNFLQAIFKTASSVVHLHLLMMLNLQWFIC